MLTMGSGGECTIKAAKKIVHKTEMAQQAPPSVGLSSAVFDSMPDPDNDDVKLFNSLTPRDAAGAYLSIALGPLCNSEYIWDAQKALALYLRPIVLYDSCYEQKGISGCSYHSGIG